MVFPRTTWSWHFLGSVGFLHSRYCHSSRRHLTHAHPLRIWVWYIAWLEGVGWRGTFRHGLLGALQQDGALKAIVSSFGMYTILPIEWGGCLGLTRMCLMILPSFWTQLLLYAPSCAHMPLSFGVRFSPWSQFLVPKRWVFALLLCTPMGRQL